jgi:drug/metabolite transporter (DMT)-like permease
MHINPIISALIAVVLWSSLPILSIYSAGVPIFLKIALSLATSSAGYMIFCYFRFKDKFLSKIKLPISYIAFYAIMLFANNTTFLISLIGEGKVENYVIMNAWPIVSLFMAAIIWQQKLTKMDYIGSALGIAGVLFMALKDSKSGSIESEGMVSFGVIISVINCLIWSLFSSYSKKFSKISVEFIGVPLGIIAVFSLVLHVLFEANYIISNVEIAALLFLGAGPWGVAYALWANALNKSSNPASMMQYGFLAPALGLTWMIVSGFAQFSLSALIAFVCIVAGSIISSMGVKGVGNI